MASLKSVLKNSKTKIIILEKKHIDSLNIIEIDSLKLRIPFHEVKILDSNINDKYVIVNCVSGEIDGDPIVRNWLVKVHKGYSIKWLLSLYLELQINKSVQTGEFGADMKVQLINDGPVTIIIDTKNKE